MRRISKADFDLLINDLFAEANSAQGTWSLAMHDRVIKSLPYFYKQDVEYLTDKTVEMILADDTKNVTRYKLSQLCTILNSRHLPYFLESFLLHKDQIGQLIEKIRSEPLGEAISKLLTSVVSSVNVKQQSISPTPIVNEKVIAGVKKTSISVTPDPA